MGTEKGTVSQNVEPFLIIPRIHDSYYSQLFLQSNTAQEFSSILFLIIIISLPTPAYPTITISGSLKRKDPFILSVFKLM
jgi:hypothetical protein